MNDEHLKAEILSKALKMVVENQNFATINVLGCLKFCFYLFIRIKHLFSRFTMEFYNNQKHFRQFRDRVNLQSCVLNEALEASKQFFQYYS